MTKRRLLFILVAAAIIAVVFVAYHLLRSRLELRWAESNMENVFRNVHAPRGPEPDEHASTDERCPAPKLEPVLSISEDTDVTLLDLPRYATCQSYFDFSGYRTDQVASVMSQHVESLLRQARALSIDPEELKLVIHRAYLYFPDTETLLISFIEHAMLAGKKVWVVVMNWERSDIVAYMQHIRVLVISPEKWQILAYVTCD